MKLMGRVHSVRYVLWGFLLAVLFSLIFVFMGVLSPLIPVIFLSVSAGILLSASIQREVKRENNEERTRIILESAYDAFIGMDNKGYVTDWNRQAELTFGWSRDEAIGKMLSDMIIPSQYREGHRKGLERYMATGVGPVLNKRIEITAQHRYGHEIPVEMTINPFKFQETTHFGSFLHNISERHEAERKVARLNQELEARVDERTKELALTNEKLQEEVSQRQKLYEQAETANRIKDEFLATVSHEIRTPLNVILGHSDLLRNAGLAMKDSEQSVEAIHRNALVQVQIIDDLLDVSRIILGKLQLNVRPVNIDEVVRAAIETVEIAAKAKDIAIHIESRDSLSAIGGDFERLQQVMWNLLSNAIKFTPKRGQVKVRILNQNSKICIEVTDSGKGIEADFLPHVFERFSQEDASTTRRYGGLGLGLSIVRHIVEGHGGSVDVTSAGKDRGATFIVNLPILAVQYSLDSENAAVSAGHFYNDKTAQATLPLQEENIFHGLRVLVVDDEPDTRNLLASLLKRSGAEIVTADSATKAFTLFQKFQPHVLLSDISMPDVDGYSLMQMIRSLPQEKGGQVLAAALTSHAREEEQVRALRAGFQRHIAKPVEATNLIRILAELSGRK